MSSYQKVILCGNVGKDPEIRYTASGTAVVSLSVATSRKWKDKTSGDSQEETEWHRVVFYDRLAEIVGEYAGKGKQILVDGRLKTRKWDKNGVETYTTEIVAESMQLLGSRDDSSGRTDRPDQPRQPAPRQPAPSSQRPVPPRQATGFDEMPDDIPF